MEESEIIRECVTYKNEAQQIIFERYFGKMMGVCLRYSKDIEQAREILHEGFFTAFKTIKKYSFDACFENWLKEIMISTAIIILHKNRQAYLIASTVNASKTKQTTAQTNNQLSDEKLESLDSETVLHALQQLAPAYRALYNLSVIDEFSIKQITEKLDLSEETAIANLAKAKFYLQKNLSAFI